MCSIHLDSTDYTQNAKGEEAVAQDRYQLPASGSAHYNHVMSSRPL